MLLNRDKSESELFKIYLQHYYLPVITLPTGKINAPGLEEILRQQKEDNVKDNLEDQITTVDNGKKVHRLYKERRVPTLKEIVKGLVKFKE